MTYSEGTNPNNVDRATIAISQYKDETLDCIATFIKNRINAHARNRNFPEVVKTAIISRFTANVNNDNYPLLQFFRESSSFFFQANKRVSSIAYRYYLVNPDPTYLNGFVDWIGKAINESITIINQNYSTIRVLPTNREQSYPFDNSSYLNQVAPYILGSFEIEEEAGIFNQVS